MSEFRIYHVTRNVAKHNYELDDKWYGSPLPKNYEDWTLSDPELYLKRVRSELSKVENALDDMSYLLREKGYPQEYEEKPELPSLEKANAHSFHKFHVRQFEYVEKLSHKLQTCGPNEINLLIPKAQRQFNVLLAAREDLLVTLVRFTEFAQQSK